MTTTATVTGPLLADDLTPIAHRPVHAELPGGPWHTAAGELVLSIATVTDGSGQFTLVLPIQSEISPSGSHWLVTVPGIAQWTIALPSAGSWHVGDPAIQVTPTVVTPAGASTGYVDGLIAALTARVAVLEALPAPTPGVAAISGFIDLAGQTRVMFRTTSSGTSQNPVVATQPGKIVGISVAATAARTGGSAVFTATVNGSDADTVATINGTTTNYAHGLGTTAFVAGDRLQVRHADSGFTPSTNFECTLWVEYT